MLQRADEMESHGETEVSPVRSTASHRDIDNLTEFSEKIVKLYAIITTERQP